ncbi:glucose uptake protein [Olsenella sp. KH3B4]|uniref:GRP family sugar transporter n=1 Tax=Olsenella sp. KH3B4 TaxID=1855394 RepID=UPI0008B9708D|nr:GRP family sugar transporter [Olsenella sp. KH3B4]SES70295.1 glucose uptake protein [Olsenella sp. KH3B4]
MGSILIGLIPALGWGFQGIIMQKIGGTTANKQMGMVLTALVMSIVVALVDPIAWSPALIAAAAVNGIPWAIAQILQIKSFDYLGVSRAMPLTSGMQLILTSVIGAFYFNEWPHAWQMGVGFAGIALIIVGTVLTTYTEAGQETTSKSDIRKGVIITAISSALYVAYATAARFFNVDSFQILLPQAMFMLAATIVISIIVSKRDSVDGVFGRVEGVFGLKSWQNMLTGVLWSVANIAVLFSNQVNGVAVGWTLANMNLIFATLGGLFILHEKKTPRSSSLSSQA